MTITRTINYTQNIPVTMGFSNVVTSSSAASVYLDFWNAGGDSKMGSIYFDDAASTGVNISYIGVSTDLTGTQAALNTCLNSAFFRNHFYEAETVEQDLLSQDRAKPSDCHGELQIQIAPDCAHGLSVGNYCRVATSTGVNTNRYLVTKIDSTNSSIRIWLTFRGDYANNDVYYASSYKSVAIGYYLQTLASVNITPIIDVSYNNPHGDFDITMSVFNSAGTQLDTGTINFVGSFFIVEPTFTTQPSSSISAPTPETTYMFNLGASIAQADNNYQSIQLLMKLYANDPAYLGVTAYTSLPGYPSAGTTAAQLQFIGEAINAKAKLSTPVYISDNSLGQFGDVQVNQRISSSPTSGVVRWHFYGLPSECNAAVSKMNYFRPVNIIKDFKIETRIVNGRTRIYSERGK
jgi:hypothetical protein